MKRFLQNTIMIFVDENKLFVEIKLWFLPKWISSETESGKVIYLLKLHNHDSGISEKIPREWSKVKFYKRKICFCKNCRFRNGSWADRIIPRTESWLFPMNLKIHERRNEQDEERSNNNRQMKKRTNITKQRKK